MGAPLSRRGALFESRREREFYRYFEPIRTLTAAGPPLCDLHDAEAVRRHRPIASPDRALTAFCQLGALRLGTRRAMLFFFDAKFAYVLAEATRTLSLEDESVHDIEDHLWLGHATIPRHFTVCEETVCRAPFSDNSPPEARQVHIIPDLTNDTKFCDRPYVLDGPKARFYAGVTVVSPRGIPIGAYCCLDDKPRPEGLDQKSINFLHDMSVTVSSHLEFVRARAEHDRGTQMVKSLGAFVEGASTLREWAEQPKRRRRRKRPEATVQTSPEQPPPVAGSADHASERGPPAPEPPENGPSPSERNNSPTYGLAGHVDLPLTPPSELLDPLGLTNTGAGAPKANVRHPDGLHEHILSSSMRLTFDRAAHLLHEAVDVDGVMFLDTTVGAYGGLVSSDSLSSSSSGHTSDAMTTGTESAGAESDTPRLAPNLPNQNPGRPCHVLAHSVNASPVDDTSADPQKPLVGENFLRALLRRYPRGKIWSFNQQGDASSDDDDSSPLSDTGDGRSRESLGSSESSRQKRARRLRFDDSREIRRLFPGVRSLAIVGMWDQNRSRWYAACAMWSFSPLRLFSDESEINYVSAFCDVIMAEVHRLETLYSDRAKADFISSISHELRSPLHGILGSVECLQDIMTDPFNVSLVSQIEVCGRTLLDIIDHVLDYSKVSHHNSQVTRRVPRDQKGRARRVSSDAARRARLGNIAVMDIDVALDEITEEVVEAAVYSFACSRTNSTFSERKVTVILDIDKRADASWICQVPLGGWKRVCINLVGNALKYTNEGYIRIRLSAEAIPGKKRRFNAVFTVTDTGRGMSKAFLENHLFEAFSQEDTLIEGTGLGMNLVAKIVRSLEGRIEVQSEKDVGTTVTVKVPLESRRPGTKGSEPSDASTDTVVTAAQAPSDTKTVIGVLGPNAELPLTEESGSSRRTEHGLRLLRASVERMLNTSSRATCSVSSLDRTPEPDVYMVFESELESMPPSFWTNKVTQPLIILCNSALSERELRAGLRSMGVSRVQCISQPCGPARINKALQTSLDLCGLHPEDRPASLQRLDSDVTTVPTKRSQARELAAKLQKLGLGHPIESVEQYDLSSSMIAQDKNFPVSPHSKHPQRSDAGQRPQLESDSGYFMGRSLSSGDSPASPLTVTPLDRLTDASRYSPQAQEGKPVRPGEAESKGGAEQFSTTSMLTKPEKGLSLLLVDDNAINLQLLVNYAKKQGHSHLTAADGSQAVEAYKDAWTRKSSSGGADAVTCEPPQVILMDINMPVLNGFEATRLIRAYEKQHSLRPANIVALTGLGSATAQQEAFSSGVDLFLTKPVRLKELTKLLDGLREAEPTSIPHEPDSEGSCNY